MALGQLTPGPSLRAAEIVIYGFEGTLDGWMIPEWARTSNEYVAEEALVSRGHAQEGDYALELRASFPGGRWTCAYVEHSLEVTDWSLFSQLSVDVYLPADAPTGLRGRLILTVGEEWTGTEMNQAAPLTPGSWTTVTVNLTPGSTDWKVPPDERFRADVRKGGVRIESDETDPPYQGSVFIDRVRLTE